MMCSFDNPEFPKTWKYLIFEADSMVLRAYKDNPNITWKQWCPSPNAGGGRDINEEEMEQEWKWLHGRPENAGGLVNYDGIVGEKP